MRSFAILMAIATSVSAIVAQGTQGVPNYSPGDPLITIINTSPTETHVYKVEGNMDNPPTAYGAGSGSLPSATILPKQTVKFQTGQGFIGAFTSHNGAGTRFEVNFRGDKTWYNSDMEFGMSDTTLGPTHGTKQIDGNESLAGEQDVLAKANAAWGEVPESEKRQLLDTGYLEGSTGSNGVLTAVHMDKQAPGSVVGFFQSTAGMNSYVDPGSVAGEDGTRDSDLANTFSWSVATKELTITGY
ncbi:MAG: hypothetical protein Q9170_001227 [Blastenia crenularia]